MSLEKFEAYLNQELKHKRFLEDGVEMIAAIKDSKRMAREATAEKEDALKEKQAVLEEIKSCKAMLEKGKKRYCR